MSDLVTIEQGIKKVSSKYHHAAADPDLKYSQEKLHVMAVVRDAKQGDISLHTATPDSLGMAMLQAGSMGLTLNPAAKQCYLIPRKMNGQVIAYASPSYMGLMHIAENSGAVKWIRAEVVFEADQFQFRGPAEKPVHYPTIKKESRKEQYAVGVYALARLDNGDYLCEFMDRDTVLAARKMSKVQNSLMWTTFWTEGWKKTAIRRLTKTLPSMNNPRLLKAVEVMDTYESGDTIEGEVERELINEDQLIILQDLVNESQVNIQKVFAVYGIDKLSDLPADRFDECESRLKQARDLKLQQEVSNA